MIKKNLLLLLALAAIWGCTPNDIGEQSDSSTPSQSSEPESGSRKNTTSQWLTALTEEGSHLFIRKANLQFEVEDVADATYAIENIVYKLGGFVENSHLKVISQESKTTDISPDSILQVTQYRTSCTLFLRIPSVSLDSALNCLAQFSTFMDFRQMTTQNIALDILLLQLDEQRFQNYKSLALNQAQRDSSVNVLFDRSAQADISKLERLKLADRVKYSSVIVDIYQPIDTRYVIMVNPETSINAYEHNFGQKIVYAFQTGWTVFKAVIVVLVQLWWLWLIGAIVIVTIRNYKRRNKVEKGKE